MPTDADAEALELGRAQAGDERAFERLVEPHRAELHAHCYRMLASADDADDAVQETMVRAWRALSRFEGRSSVRTWLFKIATNASIDLSSKRARRELPVKLDRLAQAMGSTEHTWMGPYRTAELVDARTAPEARYSSRESLELAFVAALQHLSSEQRAVFILREALGFKAAEVAAMLETTVTAVNSSLQRARVRVEALAPARSQQVELQSLGDAGVQALARRYATAIEESDIDALMALLTEDATWSMPPEPQWFQGREAVAAFLTGDVFPNRWRHLVTEANGQLAVAGYIFDDGAGCYVATALDVLDVCDGKIASVIGFLTAAAFSAEARARLGELPDVFARFSLPGRLAASGSPR